MKKDTSRILISLMAVLILTTTATALSYTMTGSSLTCTEPIPTQSSDITYEMYVIDTNGNVVGQKQTGMVEQESGEITLYVNTGLPTCNTYYYCVSYLSNEGQLISQPIYYSCSTTVTIPGGFGNMSISNQTNISINNYGTMPYNLTGNVTATKILGLPKNDFFKLAGLLCLTIIGVSIKPKQIGLIALFIGINLFTDVLGVFTLPATLIVLIMLLLLLEILKGREYF